MNEKMREMKAKIEHSKITNYSKKMSKAIRLHVH